MSILLASSFLCARSSSQRPVRALRSPKAITKPTAISSQAFDLVLPGGDLLECDMETGCKRPPSSQGVEIEVEDQWPLDAVRVGSERLAEGGLLSPEVFTDPNAAKAALALRLLKAGSAEEASEILVNGANFLAAVFNEITTPLWLFEEAVAVGEEMGMDSLVKYSQFLWRFPNSETYLAQVLSEVKQDRAIRGAALPRPLRAALLATGPGHRRGALATAPAKGSHNSTPRHVMTSSGGPPHAGNGSTSV